MTTEAYGEREIFNPVSIEARIGQISNQISQGVSICDERYRAFLDADREYDAAYARAFLNHRGPQTEKRYAAEAATLEERRNRDVADAAYRYADRMARALENELRAYQSIGASVRAAYNVAGRQ